MSPFDTEKIHPLFEEVQLAKVFPDGKTFVDCIPQLPIEEINTLYAVQKNQAGFDLKKFILDHFQLPVPHSNGYTSNTDEPVVKNIETLWPFLTRQPDKAGGTLIPLPYPYIVPGGRFGEIYYWDSYFTMLGLKASGSNDMLENMVKNFSFLIDSLGYIPNGNRTYFIGRSQPPFYSLMIQLLSEATGKEMVVEYLPTLEKEYHFWMKGREKLSATITSVHRVVKMSGGEILNRYWDENDTARPESYREDVELSHTAAQIPSILFRHLRAGAESGWDFSSRWFRNENSFDSIHTTDIIPVDLNCLIYHLEWMIAKGYQLSNNPVKETEYRTLCDNRKKAIEKYCWSNPLGFYVDYDFVLNQQLNKLTLAGITPLFLQLATNAQAKEAGKLIKEKFLRPGGVVTSLAITGQQWDAPNGWAPLHWMTIIGLENYGQTELASVIAKRWIQLNTDLFKRTGKLMEKYNVTDTHLDAGGGEYEGQDGFGWTNGVLLALIKKYGPSY